MDEFQKQMLAFMNEAKEKHKIEEERRQVEEARRLEERAQVAKRLDGLVDEIALSVKAGVKKEIKEAVEPLIDRQDKAEKETEAANAKIDRLAEELSKIRTEMAKSDGRNRETWASKVAESGGVGDIRLPEGWRARRHTPQCPDSSRMEDKNEKVKKIIREAKRIVGMKPIDKAHVLHTMRRNEELDKDMDEDKRWEEAMDETVKSFLKYEMKMKKEDIEELKIVKIFPPAKPEWNILYVELESKEMVNFMMGFTQYMRRDVKKDRPSIEKYIPKELFARYSAVEKEAFEIRKLSNFKSATNVSFGETDLILKTRSKDIQPGGTRTPWHQVQPVILPKHLPEFELRLESTAPRTLRSPKLAPGRPPLTPEQGCKRKERGTPSSPASPDLKQQKKAESMILHPAGRNTQVRPANQKIDEISLDSA